MALRIRKKLFHHIFCNHPVYIVYYYCTRKVPSVCCSQNAVYDHFQLQPANSSHSTYITQNKNEYEILICDISLNLLWNNQIMWTQTTILLDWEKKEKKMFIYTCFFIKKNHQYLIDNIQYIDRDVLQTRKLFNVIEIYER